MPQFVPLLVQNPAVGKDQSRRYCVGGHSCIIPHSSPGFVENDRLAQLIGEKGRQFARQWTTRKARLAYWKHAIDRYAELFKDYNSDLNLTALLGNSEK